MTRSRRDAAHATVDTPRVCPALEIEGIHNLKAISVGGAASVYRGVQTAIGREVVVRVLNDELTPETGQRFDRERALTGQLSGHANIACLLDTGVAADHDAPYFVMPFYRKGSLTGLINEHGPIRWREATFLIESIAVTLAEIHCRGFVHRNLRPGKILLTDFLLPRVAGFERALPAGCIPSGSEPGAAHFFSPADQAAHASPTEDVYGLGALLWALLAGQAHFDPTRDSTLEGLDAPTATILARQGRMPAAVEPPPQPILDLMARAMSADLLRRPANAAAFVTDLRRTVAEVEQRSPQNTSTGVRHPLATTAVPPGLTDSDSDSQSDHDQGGSAVMSNVAIYLLAVVGGISGIVLAVVTAALLTVS
ncbi:MAG: protein kinase [Actinomycetia bacterium]|nr:protein kinase [Actinomycetes bacterium]